MCHFICEIRSGYPGSGWLNVGISDKWKIRTGTVHNEEQRIATGKQRRQLAVCVPSVRIANCVPVVSSTAARSLGMNHNEEATPTRNHSANGKSCHGRPIEFLIPRDDSLSRTSLPNVFPPRR